MNTYLDTLQLYTIHHTEQLQPHIILQQDGAPVQAYHGKEISGKTG